MKVTEVPPDIAQVIRPKIADLIDAGCRASLGAYTPDSIFERIKTQTCFLLIAGEGREVTGLAIISISSFPGGLHAVTIEILEGESSAQTAIREYVERAAMHAGCNAVLAYAEKRAPKHYKDYKLARYLMVKELRPQHAA